MKTEKVKLKVAVLKARPFGCDVWVVVGAWEEFAQWCREKWKVKMPRGGDGGGCWRIGEAAEVVVWLPSGMEGRELMAHLVHELVHAAWRTLQKVGVRVGVENQEMLAYLVDDLFAQAMVGLGVRLEW